MDDKTFSQDEPNVVNEHKDTSSNSSLTLPEILSLPSTTSVTGQKPTLRFPTNFPKKLDYRYLELYGTNTPLRLNRNTFVALPPLFGQHLDSIRLHTGHSTDYSIDTIFTRIYKSIKSKYLHTTIHTKYNSRIFAPSIYFNRTHLQIR